jgi:hypothetical protein
MLLRVFQITYSPSFLTKRDNYFASIGFGGLLVIIQYRHMHYCNITSVLHHHFGQLVCSDPFWNSELLLDVKSFNFSCQFCCIIFHDPCTLQLNTPHFEAKPTNIYFWGSNRQTVDDSIRVPNKHFLHAPQGMAPLCPKHLLILLLNLMSHLLKLAVIIHLDMNYTVDSKRTLHRGHVSTCS